MVLACRTPCDCPPLGRKWPTTAALQREIKRQFPGLHSQSVQQIVADFCEAIASAELLHKHGEPYEYPHKKPRFRQVIFTNQGAKVRNGVLSLPCGHAGRLSVRLPKGLTLPGRLMEVRLDYGCVEIVCEVVDDRRAEGSIVGVDLGVNTVIAATDGEKAVLISGRELKATIQLRNKRLAEITAQLAPKTKVRGATSNCNGGSTARWRTQRTKCVICATRPHARLPMPFPLPKPMSANRSMMRRRRWDGDRRKPLPLPVIARSFPCSPTSWLPVWRSMNPTRRRPARYAAHGRNIVVCIAVSADTQPPAMWWDAPISALLALMVLSDQVVAYPTLSNGVILPSIPAPSRVVLWTPGKSLGSSPEKPRPFRGSGVSPATRL